MHTEGIIYAVLGWLFYTMHRSFREGWTQARLARTLLLTALAIFFRPAIAVGLLPALAIWTAAEGHIRRRTVLLMAAAFILLIAGLSFFYPDTLTLIPRTLSHRQQEYQSLTGSSRIDLPSLQPSWTSLWDVLPHALLNGLFQPLPGVGGQKVYLFFSLELLFVWIIAIAALAMTLLRRRNHPATSAGVTTRPLPPISSACLLLALPGMLLIGYIIPFVGAIVRYRSIYLPFLLAPCLAGFQNHRLYQKLKNRLTTYIFK